jgi:hypothetical protein
MVEGGIAAPVCMVGGLPVAEGREAALAFIPGSMGTPPLCGWGRGEEGSSPGAGEVNGSACREVLGPTVGGCCRVDSITWASEEGSTTLSEVSRAGAAVGFAATGAICFATKP